MNKIIQKFGVGVATAVVTAASFAMPVFAATTVVVTPSNTQGFSEADTRPGGDVNFVSDSTAPLGIGALQLTTDATTTSKAQYMHAAEAGTLLSDVTDLNYFTRQISGPVYAAASYQLPVDLNGDAVGGFTTFVYEPYQNGVVVPDEWQEWDVDQDQFWSSRTFSEGTCSVTAGAGGAPFYSLAGLQAACPDAVVLGYGVNIGSNNPGYDVYTDALTFNDTTYDFEPYVVATNKDQCKNNGYKNVTDASGQPFKNQGLCVSYTNHQ